MSGQLDTSGLIAKLEGLTGPDRDAGFEVLLACGWTKRLRGHFYGPLYWWSPPGKGRGYDQDRLPCPTASLDAALALVDEKLPGCRVMTERTFEGAGWAMLQPDPACERPMADGATPALAVLIALLKALEAGR